MSAISDRFDTDPEETAAIMRAARERRLSLWANHVETHVQPGMMVHVDGDVCICTDCTAKRRQPRIGPTLRNTNHRRKVQQVSLDGPDDSVGSKPKPRQETYQINAPRRVPGGGTGRFGSKLWG